MSFHPTSLIDPGAKIGANVTIGPYAIIAEETEIGDDCVIEAAAQIRRGTRLGHRCFVGSGTILGGDPQYRGFDRNIPSGVSVGDDNVIREYATIHRSIHPGGETRLGEGNYLMAGSHVGHDASVGNFNTLANNVLLAGHVRVGDRCFLGGGSVFHQFIRVGDLAITQGNSGFSLDLPPLVIGYGINLVAGVNVIGLKRAGFSPSEIRAVKEGFREIFRGGTPIREVLARNTEDTHPGPLQIFYRFLREESKKGVCIRSRGDREDS